MSIINRLFPKSLKPEDVRGTQPTKEGPLPKQNSIPVFVVSDGEETKTTRALSPLEEYQAQMEKDAVGEARTLADVPLSATDETLPSRPEGVEEEDVGAGTMRQEPVPREQAEPPRDKADSEPSLAGVEIEWELPMSAAAVSAAPVTPPGSAGGFSLGSEEEPGTARHVPLILSRAEAYILMRTLRHAARFEPSLAMYLVRKARSRGVPDARIEYLLSLFGLA